MPEQETFTLRNSAGNSYVFTGPVYITAHDGLGLVPPRRYVRSGPQQHGQTLGAAYLNPRIVTLALHYQCFTEAEIETERQKISVILNDLNAPIWLDIEMPSGHNRRLDVAYYNEMKGPREATGLWYTAKDTLQLIADDPIWYEQTALTEEFYIGPQYYYAGGNGMPVPLEIPWEVGSSSIFESRTIPYEGTWESLPIINILGPCTSVEINNSSTGEFIRIKDGIFITENNYLVIDCRYGYKTVKDARNVDVPEYLTEDSKLATFHIAPPDQVIDGENRVRVTATDMTESSRITLTYWHRYWSY